MDAKPFARNNLDLETSPYLLQHSDNPVHWQPWNRAVLDHAAERDVPILLSVGYAACHWCHVMAHESFESEGIAAVMNDLFVNIKVDREERPDLDTVYQSALALMGEHGGWPLTMFLTPQGRPFWGGTYFPPDSRYGRPGFADVLRTISTIYRENPEKVTHNADALGEALAKVSAPRDPQDIDPGLLDQVAERLAREVDPFHGGIGHAPKFPQVPALTLLWRAWLRTGKEPYRQAVTLTLSKISNGGIYDHLGGGYARYAVDGEWLVPHFEKMLYDNAQLLDLIALVWQETRDPLYARRIRETIDWLMREMIAGEGPDGSGPVGAFASSLDADSEGEEGKFYVWSEAEIDHVLGADAAAFKQLYDVTGPGNWEGKTILNRTATPDSDEAVEVSLASARERLLSRRAGRVRPGWDDKVLADWNGLMIAALANCGAALGEPKWITAAARAFAFIAKQMSSGNRLHHSWRQGRLGAPATLDDYASLARAALVLHELTGEDDYLRKARNWISVLDRHYADQDHGGYFLTADDTDDVIVRSRTATDGATPSGAGLLLEVLNRLYLLTGEDEYRTKADALKKAFSGEAARNVFGLATFLGACELPTAADQVIVIGEAGDPAAAALVAEVHGRSLPNRVLQVLRPDQDLANGHPAAGKSQVDGRATAYLCRDMTCSLPFADPAALGAALDLR